jgi:chromate transporter
MKQYIEIFLVFMKMGVITFGGGYAMMPIIERELINKRGWVTSEEVMDYYTIAQVTPGIIAVNVSTFVGHKRAGVVGGVLATCGFVFLPVCAVVLIGLCLRNFADLPVVKHAFGGIRVAVGALILQTIWKMRKGAFKDKVSIIICALSFVMSVVFGANPVILVAAFGLLGLVLYRPRPAKKETGEAKK